MKKKLGIILVMIMAAAGLSSCTSSMSYSDYDFDEYMEVGEYKGLDVAPYTVTVSNEDLYTEIENRLQAAAETTDLEEGAAVEEGDTLNIDYVGKIDGKAFDNGSAEGASLQIGSNSFIDGFEDGLIGKTIGSEAVLNLTFPEDYQEESLQGKDVEFTVTINSEQERRFLIIIWNLSRRTAITKQWTNMRQPSGKTFTPRRRRKP